MEHRRDGRNAAPTRKRQFFNHQSHQWGKFPNLKVSSLTNFYNKFEYPDFEEPGNHRDGDIGIVTSWLKINQGRNKSYKDFVLEVGEGVSHIRSVRL